MHASTKKWLFTKISSFVLIPLMTWFILNFVSIYENDYQTVLLFFTQQPTKILFSIFIVVAFFFSEDGRILGFSRTSDEEQKFLPEKSKLFENSKVWASQKIITYHGGRDGRRLGRPHRR